MLTENDEKISETVAADDNTSERKETMEPTPEAAPRLATSSFKKLDELLTRTCLYGNFIEEEMYRDIVENTGGSTAAAVSPKKEQGGISSCGESEEASFVVPLSSRGPSTSIAPSGAGGDGNDDKRESLARSEKKAKEGSIADNIGLQQPAMVTGGTLHPHQLIGYSWLLSLFKNGVNGILADEMGLGKTIQVIALLAELYTNQVWGPHLVVAPLSTLSNWEAEFKKWAPDIPLLVYHGTREERNTQRADIRKMSQPVPTELIDALRDGWDGSTERRGKGRGRGGSKYYSSGRSGNNNMQAAPRSASEVAVEIGKRGYGGVVITSYEVARMDTRYIRRQPSYRWGVLVVDEAHRLKNFECRLIKVMRQLPSTARVLLTGTPLQNNLSELWSILNFIVPEVFEELGEFEAWFNIDNPEEEGDAEEKEAKKVEGETANEPTAAPEKEGEKREEKETDIKTPQKEEPSSKKETHTEQVDISLPQAFDQQHKGAPPLHVVHPSPVALRAKRHREESISSPSSTDSEELIEEREEEEEANANRQSNFSVEEVADDETELPPPCHAEEKKICSSITQEHPNEEASRGHEQPLHTDAAVQSHHLPHHHSHRTTSAVVSSARASLYRHSLQQAHIIFKMHKVLKPFMLRRIKTEIPHLHLPEKYEVVLYCPMSAHQAKLYDSIRSGELGKYNRNMMHLRKMCCHVHMFREFDQFLPFLADHPILADWPMTKLQDYLDALLEESSKLALLHRLLPNLRKGQSHGRPHKVLLFSQFTSMLDILEDYLLVMQYLQKVEYTYLRLDGRDSRGDRNTRIGQFQSLSEDYFLFLISTRAGGLGLNLSAADTVILFDADFNPHCDLQAIDRCHRIGQDREVVVYRLVCPGTVDDAILRINLRKLRMEQTIIGAGKFNMQNWVKKANSSTTTVIGSNREDADAMKETDDAPFSVAKEGGKAGIEHNNNNNDDEKDTVRRLRAEENIVEQEEYMIQETLRRIMDLKNRTRHVGDAHTQDLSDAKLRELTHRETVVAWCRKEKEERLRKQKEQEVVQKEKDAFQVYTESEVISGSNAGGGGGDSDGQKEFDLLV